MITVFKDQSNYDQTAITEYHCKSSDNSVTNTTRLMFSNIGNPSGFKLSVFVVIYVLIWLLCIRVCFRITSTNLIFVFICVCLL